MTKQNEEELLRRRNELEAELDQVKETLSCLEKDRREKQVAEIIEMVKRDPSIWDTRLVTDSENVYAYEKYRVYLELVYDPLDDD